MLGRAASIGLAGADNDVRPGHGWSTHANEVVPVNARGWSRRRRLDLQDRLASSRGHLSLYRSETRSDGRCTLCGDNLLDPDQPPQSPEGWEWWLLWVTKKGDQGGLPGPPHRTQHAARCPNAPRTRLLQSHRQTQPDSERRHPAATSNLSRSRGLLGPCAAMSGMHGPEGVPWCSNAPGLPGRRYPPEARICATGTARSRSTTPAGKW